MEGSDKDVLFMIRSNVAYDGVRDASPPAMGNPLTFSPGNLLQVVEILNDEWWVARLLGDGPLCGLIPSPAAFLHRFRGGSRATKSASNPYISKVAEEHTTPGARDGNFTEDVPYGKEFLSTKYNQEVRRQLRAIDRPYPDMDVYDLAPRIRPLLLVGPSRLGCAVTDKIQLALVNYLKLAFEESCVVAPQHEWSGQTKKRRSALRLKPSYVGAKPKNGELLDAAKVFNKEDLDFINRAAKQEKLPILQVEAEDIPLARASSLMPIVVVIKILDTRVYRRLARDMDTSDEDDMHNLTAQIRNCEMVVVMKSQHVDLVLADSRLDHCCYQLAAFVDVHLAETWFSPIRDPSQVLQANSPMSTGDESRNEGANNSRRSMFIHGSLRPMGI